MPIGCRRTTATEIQSLEHTTVCLIDLLNSEKLSEMMTSLTRIATDGRVNDDEKSQMDGIINYFDELRVRIEELMLYEEPRN